MLAGRTRRVRSSTMRPGVALGAVLAVLALAMGVGAWASHGSHQTAAAPTRLTGKIDPHVAAGAHDFVQFACAACPESLGRGGASPYVPALSGIGKSLTVVNADADHHARSG